jgi:[ribosomal protein S18]-alanine N-acetyltransferase
LHIEVRPGSAADLASIAQIQAASPEASQWDVPEYLKYDLIVVTCHRRTAGFAVARRVAENEGELLNLAVDPEFRRRGLGRRLVVHLTSAHPGNLWLEVRASNVAARKFYKCLGFSEVGCRQDYYPDSRESAIVMNVHS